MECNSVLHSTRERKLQNREIDLPSDYFSVTREARQNPRPFKAVELDFIFCYYSLAGHLRFSSILCPGKSVDYLKVTDLKCINGP